MHEKGYERTGEWKWNLVLLHLLKLWIATNIFHFLPLSARPTPRTWRASTARVCTSRFVCATFTRSKKWPPPSAESGPACGRSGMCLICSHTRCTHTHTLKHTHTHTNTYEGLYELVKSHTNKMVQFPPCSPTAISLIKIVCVSISNRVSFSFSSSLIMDCYVRRVIITQNCHWYQMHEKGVNANWWT